LTSSHDAILRLWDLEKGSIVARASTENGSQLLFVSPDGRQVITAGGKEWDAVSKSNKDYRDYALRLWRLPESVWPKETTSTSSAQEIASVSSELNETGQTQREESEGQGSGLGNQADPN
jgi:WD40 repeat protein